MAGPSPSPSTARLEAICGPMFSGKSTELIRRLQRAAAAGQATLAFKPSHDTRYHAEAISTHTGAKLPAGAVESAAEILSHAANAHTIGIDEAHFFGTSLIEPIRALLARGTRVIVAGLERDHRGRHFEPFPWLLCEADEVVKLAGPCAVCGKPALHSQRLVDSPDRIVVGGAEAYQPRCRECFQPGR